MKITRSTLKQLIKKTILESRWDYDPDEYYGEKRRNKELYGGPGEIVTGLDAANTKIRKAAKEREERETEESTESEGQTDLERLVGELTAESGLDYTDVMERLEDGFREKFETEELTLD